MKYFLKIVLIISIGITFCCNATSDFDVYTATDSVPIGQVFIYQKSNIDNSNKGKIAVYYATTGEIESFKWHQGNNRATIVKAKINPSTLNVSYFEASRLFSNGEQKVSAVLDASAENEMVVKLGDEIQRVQIKSMPWHSYDFDFASLGYAYRFLSNKKSEYSFNVFDLDLLQKPPQFKDFGRVQLVYQSDEVRGTRNVLMYKINGPGLDNRGGTIWFDKEGEYLVAFEIEKPDEPGYDSGKLVLEQIIELDDKGWIAFKINAINPK